MNLIFFLHIFKKKSNISIFWGISINKILLYCFFGEFRSIGCNSHTVKTQNTSLTELEKNF